MKVTTRIATPTDVIAAGPDAVKHFRKMIKRGESPRFAEMCALRAAPQLNTDTSLIAAQNQERRGATLADQFRGNENLLQYRIDQARKQGYNPSANDFYDCTRARFAGDKRAWTGSHQSLDDVKRDMERTGDGMERSGSTLVAPNTDVAPMPVTRLADDLIDEMAAKETAANPDLAFKDQREVREMIVDKYGNDGKQVD